MEESVFSKIVKGEIPSHKVYEDDKTMAFMDIHPIVPGMIVLVTKQQVENVDALDDDTYTSLWEAAKKLSLRLRAVYPDAKKIAMQVEGFDVAHAHVKLFPLHAADDLNIKQDMSQEPDHEALAQAAERIRF